MGIVSQFDKKVIIHTFDWNNPECETTYGTTFTNHGSHHEVIAMMIKSQKKGRQLGQWTDDKKAAEFIEKIVKERGVGVHDVLLPRTALEGFPSVVYLSAGMKHYADKARIIVNEDGSVKTAYPFSRIETVDDAVAEFIRNNPNINLDEVLLNINLVLP